jgi:hypothetical protein
MSKHKHGALLPAVFRPLGAALGRNGVSQFLSQVLDEPGKYARS